MLRARYKQQTWSSDSLREANPRASRAPARNIPRTTYKMFSTGFVQFSAQLHFNYRAGKRRAVSLGGSALHPANATGRASLETTRRTRIAAAAGLLALLPLSTWAAATYSDVLHETDVMMKVPDGVELATDIYRPASGATPIAQRLPALLHRTPYDKQAAAAVSIAEQ